ncbi:MAG: SIMPL domain-containing protein [Gemmatimonadetes bacterium]|nr:SIMPL domain-containing protein [Gemmatimonadota bacterium]
MIRILSSAIVALALWSCTLQAGPRRPGFPGGGPQSPPPRPSPPTVQTPPAAATERAIEVTATGEVEAPPDIARITLAIESRAETAEAAARENSERTGRVLTALRQAVAANDRVQTRGYTLYPEYRYGPDVERVEQRVIGYRALNQITVTMHALDSVGTLIDRGLAAGANRVDALAFDLEEPAEHREEALRQAVEKARREAQAIAGALGVELGPVLEARTESAAVTPLFAEAYARAGVQAAALPTPVEPGALTVRATVTIRFQVGGRR